MKFRSKTALRQELLNTLAQTGTNHSTEQAVILNGMGSDLYGPAMTKTRAKRKVLTQKLSLSLVDAAKARKALDNVRSYWNTYHCQNRLFTSNGRLFGKYCKNRFCTICCSIRKATIINKYLPIIETWKEPHFVTLTVKAIPAYRLKIVMNRMMIGFQRITAKYRKRCKRGNAGLLQGIKSLECNFNPQKRTYNPHFHILVPDSITASILIEEWLKLWTRKWAVPQAQNSQRVFMNRTAVIEVVKYGSKIISEPDEKKGTNSSKIYAAALDNIYSAMSGLRIFERFGFNLPVTLTRSGQSVATTDFREWLFCPEYFDWLSKDFEAPLSSFQPTTLLMDILLNNIDIEAF